MINSVRGTTYSPEIDVKQYPLGKQHKVVQVPVSHPHQVRHHAAPRAATCKVVKGFALHTQRSSGVRVVVPQKLQHAIGWEFVRYKNVEVNMGCVVSRY